MKKVNVEKNNFGCEDVQRSS